MKLPILALITALLAGCNYDDPKHVQSQKAEQAAQAINFSENAEIDNIKHRLELTNKPGAIGYIVLLNQMGQPIAYDTVKGKITSSGKRLTKPFDETVNGIRTAPSDEGTWGSSDSYLYYWTVNGVYRQWSGLYLYSDQPIRLSQPTLVVEAK
jgi:hypothetical protein